MVTQSPEATDRILSTRQVSECTGLHPVTIWRHAKTGDFPLPLKLTARKNGFLYSEIMAWLAKRERANYGTRTAA